MIKRLLAGLLRGLAPAAVLAVLLVTQFPVPAAAAETGEGSPDADSPFDWVRQFGTAGYDGVSRMAVDTTGVYAAGWGGSSPGQSFLRKYDTGGNELWSRNSGACIAAVPGKVFVGDLGSLRSYVSDGNGLWAVDMNDEQHLYGATDIAADASGVYVAGCLWSQSSGDHCGHFLRKCDANDGHIVWTRLLGSGWGDTGVGGICATSGGIYFALRDLNSEIAGVDDFIYKYDADGDQVWVRRIGLSGGYTQDICADATGVYVGGSTSYAWESTSDAFIRKYDADGNEKWTRLFGSDSGDGAFDMSLYGGSIYVAGCTWGVLPGQVGHGGGDVFVCRYDTDGDQVWVRQLGSSLEDDSVQISVSAGGIYLGGRTRGAMPGCSNQGLDDAYLGRLAIGGVLGTPGWEVQDAPAKIMEGGEQWCPSLIGVWGNASDDVFAVTSCGALIHYDGSMWSLLDGGPLVSVPRETELGGRMDDIWCSSSSDVFVAGDLSWRQACVFHYDGSAWTKQVELGGDTTAIYGIWGSSPSDVFAVGFADDAGFVLHYDGVSWTSLVGAGGSRLAFDTRAHDVWGTSPSDVFVVGNSTDSSVGAVYHYDGSRWSTVWESSASALSLDGLTLNGVWGSSPSDVFAVGGGWGSAGRREVILHYDGSSWSLMDGGTTYGLASVWGSSPSDVFAVGGGWGAPEYTEYRGVILHYDGESWSQMATGEVSGLSGVWGSSSSDVFVVGRGGMILHDAGPVPPGAATGETEGITAASAGLDGLLTSLGGASSVQVSFEWGLTTDYGNATTPQTMSCTGAFSAVVGGLSPGTTYHYRVMVVGSSAVYGSDRAFLTRAQVTGPGSPEGRPADPSGEAVTIDPAAPVTAPDAAAGEPTPPGTTAGESRSLEPLVPEAGPSAASEPTAGARLWLYPVAVVGGFLALSAAASFGAWLRGRLLR